MVNVTGGQILGNSGADSITINGKVNSALVHGGADNDSITLGTIVGGTVGGGLGADTLIVSSKVAGAEVLMSSKSDPNSSSDKADSLSVVGSVSNSTIYAGAGDDNMSFDSHLIAGELFAGSGADTVRLVVPWVEPSSCPMALTLFQQSMLTVHRFLVGLRMTPLNFTGNVKDSSIVGGFGVDSLVLGNAAADFVRGSTVYGGSPSDGASALDGADYISVGGSLSASAVYGNSGADSLLVGGNTTATSLFGGADNDLVSVSGNVSAGQIFTGSGVDSVIVTGSLLGSATVRLDNSDGSEEAADSITIGNISSGVVYGESGADTFNISGDASKASLYGGAQNDSVTIGGSLSSGLVEGAEGADTIAVANLIKSTVKGGIGDDLISAFWCPFCWSYLWQQR